MALCGRMLYTAGEPQFGLAERSFSVDQTQGGPGRAGSDRFWPQLSSHKRRTVSAHSPIPASVRASPFFSVFLSILVPPLNPVPLTPTKQIKCAWAK